MSEENVELTEIKNIVENEVKQIVDEVKNDDLNDWGEIIEKVKNSGFIIDDENFEQVQKLVRHEYYQKHMDIMISRSLMYYEKNKEKVLEKNNSCKTLINRIIFHNMIERISFYRCAFYLRY